jgi:SAM-dependent methyltransferase
MNEHEREAATQAGRNRLYPSLRDPNYLVLRQRRLLFERWLARVPADHLNVLDVGGRLQPYRPLVEHRLTRYVAVDLQSTPLVNMIGRAESLPLADEMFDLVFCTQVLEYIYEPARVTAEIYRVLKPGGILLISVPTIAMRDADEEYWRFQPASLRKLLAAFSSVEIAAEGSSVTGFFRMVNVFLARALRFKVLQQIYSYSGAPILNLTGRCLDSAAPTRNDQFVVNYSAIAQK